MRFELTTSAVVLLKSAAAWPPGVCTAIGYAGGRIYISLCSELHAAGSGVYHGLSEAGYVEGHVAIEYRAEGHIDRFPARFFSPDEGVPEITRRRFRAR